MKLTKSILKRIISEELLPEGYVKIGSDIDADFRGNMVQLISSTGRLPLDKKSMRALLYMIKQNLPATGYASMARKKGINVDEAVLNEGKRFTLPNGVKIELPSNAGNDPFIIYGFGKNKITMYKKEMVIFLKQIQKQAGIR